MDCAIITPIGPGHRALFEESCAPSVETAIGFSKGPFEQIHHYAMDDTQGLHGRSARRNAAIRQAQEAGIAWIFFLDADDVLTPNAFEAFGARLAAEPDLDALWGLICEFDAMGEPQLRDGQPAEISAYAEFLATPPFFAVQIGAFIRTELVARFGFDEAMDTGEDYKLYLQLWQTGNCGKRPEIFFVNRRDQHSTGPRSATGADWARQVERMWADAVERDPVWAQLEHRGVAAKMQITNPLDIIQNTHLQGRFFEDSSLEKLRDLIGVAHPHIVEVGANIGNHVVWYAQHLDPARIYPVEPNPAALTLLEGNIAANGIEDLIDRRGMGFGVGRAEGSFRAETAEENNLGATTLVADDAGELKVVTLDALMTDARADFLKIDAEGMELDVLAGAEALIARDRPLIWVETRRDNLLAFAQEWCRAHDYVLIDSVFYVHSIDYFAIPRERA